MTAPDFTIKSDYRGDTGVPASPSGHSAEPESVFPVSALRASVPNAEGHCPSGYTPETWAAKQAEVAEFSRRNPFDEPSAERKANGEARLRAAMSIQCADVPDQFALVRRGDLITIMHEFIRYRAGFEIWRKERAARASAIEA